MQQTQTLWAKHVLAPEGWYSSVRLVISGDGKIVDFSSNCEATGERFDILLPAPANLHSHAFQRAMAGMTEQRGSNSSDDFWTWRHLVYRFLNCLTPDDVLAIAAQAQMEMLESGYAAVGEFHYLHHQPNGNAYDDVAEMSAAIVAAAAETGIGLVLLPVLYQYGGCHRQPLARGQLRFGNTLTQFLDLWQCARNHLSVLPPDAGIGVAPHSLRAVDKDGIDFAATVAFDVPVHLHIAEQIKEVEEIESALGARPVNWLLVNAEVNSRWCLIHATHMAPDETRALAQTGAVVGLCPITESNLGDGVFDGRRYLDANGRWGIGSDSNIKISLAEELRTLEYSQRLQEKRRAVLAESGGSVGRLLFDNACVGGAQALGRNAGKIETGCFADIVALDGDTVNLSALQEDAILDAWIFASDDRVVKSVWSAGRHLVKNGKHIDREKICQRYKKTMLSLRHKI